MFEVDPDAKPVAKYVLGALLLIVAPCVFFFLLPASGEWGRAPTIVGLASPIAIVLCVDLSLRRFFESPSQTGRPRAIAVLLGMSWVGCAWVAAFMLGQSAAK